MTDADHADDLALLTNKPAREESLLHCLDQAAGSIDFYVNLDKIESMCFKQKRAISTLNNIYIYISWRR